MTTTAHDYPRAALGAEELDELRASVRHALNQLAPVAHTAQNVESPASWDVDVWARLCREIDLSAISIPTEYGGQGYGSVEQGVVLEELGRVLYSGPYLASAAIAAGIMMVCGDRDANERWLPAVARGDIVATFAYAEDGVWSMADRPATLAAASYDSPPEEVSVSGTKRSVLLGGDAQMLIVTAALHGAPALVAVHTDQPGVQRDAEPVMDLTRPLSTVTFTDARGQVIRTVRPIETTLRAVASLAGSALASEQVGGARAALDLTIGYARQRIQFGREIGSFQAVRHRLADLHGEVEVAAAAARAAAASPDWFSTETAISVATAQSFCSETYLLVAEQTIQLHGGIGFTWEYPAHLYFKRAKSSELIFGDPAQHRARLHELLVTGAMS